MAPSEAPEGMASGETAVVETLKSAEPSPSKEHKAAGVNEKVVLPWHLHWDGHRMTDDEVVSFLRLLVSAGADTTYHLLGSMLAIGLRDPALLERLDGERERIDDYVLETLRYESPISTIPREVMVDTRLGDVELTAGADVLVHLGSANRDETHYTDPDVFDLDRDTSDHLGFGIGRHFCAGSRLALLEARIGFEVLLDRLKELRLAPGEPAEIIGFAFRGPSRLPVSFRAV